MNAIIGTYDPEQIDQDVNIYYRNITKLERTFMNTPAPLTIAKTVSKNTFSFLSKSTIVNNAYICIPLNTVRVYDDCW